MQGGRGVGGRCRGCRGVGGRCRWEVEVLEVDARESRGVGGRCMRR